MVFMKLFFFIIRLSSQIIFDSYVNIYDFFTSLRSSRNFSQCDIFIPMHTMWIGPHVLPCSFPTWRDFLMIIILFFLGIFIFLGPAERWNSREIKRRKDWWKKKKGSSSHCNQTWSSKPFISKLCTPHVGPSWFQIWKKDLNFRFWA